MFVKTGILPGPSGLSCSSSRGSPESTLNWAGWGHLGSSQDLLSLPLVLNVASDLHTFIASSVNEESRVGL